MTLYPQHPQEDNTFYKGMCRFLHCPNGIDETIPEPYSNMCRQCYDEYMKILIESNDYKRTN